MNYIEDINRILFFLASRDVMCLDVDTLKKNYQIKCAGAIMLFGNELPYTLEVCIKAMKCGIAEYLIICGGEGHATEILRKNVRAMERCQEIIGELKNMSEAEIFGALAVKYYGIPKEQVILDNASTNCGANAKNGFEYFQQLPKSDGHVIVVQDPIMQRRSKASLMMYMEEEKIISYAPFIPQVGEGLVYKNTITFLWSRERFLDLLLGEIPRLKDDGNGYGPRGRGFIPHVDVPQEILETYDRVRGIIGNRTRSNNLIVSKNFI